MNKEPELSNRLFRFLYFVKVGTKVDFLKKALKQLLQVNPKPNISSYKIPKPNPPPPKSNTPPPAHTHTVNIPSHTHSADIPSNIAESSQTPQKSKPDIQRKHKSESPTDCQDPKKEFLKIFKQLTYRHRTWDIWKDFVVMAACALSNPADKSHYDEREALYLKIIKNYNKQEQALFPELFTEMVMALELNQEQDFLGSIFMELNLGNEAGGQFFTPYHVCELMAKVTLGDVRTQVEKKGYITINDPCCGAGATLIAGIHEARRQLEKVGLNWQNHVLLSAQDIDYTAALMCYIQLSLLGAAAYIKVGNSLTAPMCSTDTLDNYWFTLMYFSDIWATRRFIKNTGTLLN